MAIHSQTEDDTQNQSRPNAQALKIYAVAQANTGANFDTATANLAPVAVSTDEYGIMDPNTERSTRSTLSNGVTNTEK